MANELQDILDSIKNDKDTNLLPTNLKKGVKVLGVEGTFEGGTDTSDATATDKDIVLNKTAYVDGKKIVGSLKQEQIIYNYVTLDAEFRSVYFGEYTEETQRVFESFTATLNGKKINISFTDSTTSTIDLTNVIGTNILRTYSIGYEVEKNVRYVYVALSNAIIKRLKVNISTGTILETKDTKVRDTNGTNIYSGTVAGIVIYPNMYSTDFMYNYTKSGGETITNFTYFDDEDNDYSLGIRSAYYQMGSWSPDYDKATFYNKNAGCVYYDFLIIHKGAKALKLYHSNNLKVDGGANTIYVDPHLTKLYVQTSGNSIYTYDIILSEEFTLSLENPRKLEELSTYKRDYNTVRFCMGLNDNLIVFGFDKMLVLYDSLNNSIVDTLATDTALTTNDAVLDYTKIVRNSDMAYLISINGRQVVSGATIDKVQYYCPDHLELTSSASILENERAVVENGIVTGTMANNGQLNYIPSSNDQTIPAGYTSGGTVSAANITKLTDYTNCLILSNKILGDATKYVELTSLESSGKQYFDLGFVHTANTKMVIDCLVPQTSLTDWQSLFGARNSSYQKNAMVFFTRFRGQNLPYYNRSGVESAGTNFIYGKRITVTAQGKVCSWTDGTNTYSVTTTGTVDNGTNTMFLLNNNTASGSGKIPDTSPVAATIYSCKVYEGDTLIKDFVPALDSTGKICLYEKIDGSFYYGLGTGEFIAGGVIE